MRLRTLTQGRTCRVPGRGPHGTPGSRPEAAGEREVIRFGWGPGRPAGWAGCRGWRAGCGWAVAPGGWGVVRWADAGGPPGGWHGGDGQAGTRVGPGTASVGVLGGDPAGLFLLPVGAGAQRADVVDVRGAVRVAGAVWMPRCGMVEIGVASTSLRTSPSPRSCANDTRPASTPARRLGNRSNSRHSRSSSSRRSRRVCRARIPSHCSTDTPVLASTSPVSSSRETVTTTASTSRRSAVTTASNADANAGSPANTGRPNGTSGSAGCAPGSGCPSTAARSAAFRA